MKFSYCNEVIKYLCIKLHHWTQGDTNNKDFFIIGNLI